MADMRNRTPFYGAVPTSKLQADHVFFSDGSTLQEQADETFELIDTITVEEAITTISYTLTTPLKEMYINCAYAAAAGASGVQTNINTTDITIGVANTLATSARYTQTYVQIYKGFIRGYTSNSTSSAKGAGLMYINPTTQAADAITQIDITSITAAVPIPVGSIITIYGIPA